MDDPRHRWRELDGLRAIAVIAVIAFHLDASWAVGGFLGVDVFFVISGFLITTLLIGERDRTGRVALGRFWSRRVRRLAPPAVVMILATLVATYAWFVPERWSTVRGDAVASLVWVANWRFIEDDGGYFAAGLGPSPLEHMWSLAVEEQFYLLWPVAMVAVMWLWRRRTGTPALVLALAAVASAVWMAVLYDPAALDRVYFGTDTRAQQLLVGAALAWAVRRWPTLTSERVQRGMRPLVWLAAAAVLVAMVTVEGDSPWLYRGGFLAVSVGAAIVVLAARSGSWAVRPLSWRPLVAIGERSYGLYLWHWPVIVFVGAPIGLELTGLPLVAVQIGMVALLAEVSHRVVEMPARTARRPRAAVAGWTAAALFAGVVAVTVLVPPAGRTLSTDEAVTPYVQLPGGATARIDPVSALAAPLDGVAIDGAPGDPMVGNDVGVAVAPLNERRSAPADGPRQSAAPEDEEASARDVTDDREAADVAGAVEPHDASTAAEAGGPSVAAAAPPSGATGADDAPPWDETGSDGRTQADPTAARPTSVLVYGDSTAFVFSRNSPRPDDDWVVAGYSTPGCGIVGGRPVDPSGGEPLESPPRCDLWRAGWRGAIQQFDADVAMMMAGAWAVFDHEVDGRVVRFPSAEWEAHVADAVGSFIAAVDSPARRIVLLRLPCMESVDAETMVRNDRTRVAAYNAILDTVAGEHPRTEVMRFDDILCPDGEPLRQVDGETLRYDGVHLTPGGSAYVWNRVFEALGAR